jgi:hypothetical protein
MQTEHLYLRHTNRYVDSYRYLDNEEYLCSVTLTPPRQIREGNGFDDLGTYVRLGRIPAGASARDRRDVLKAARNTFSHHGCAHDYDCCGCRSVSARATLRGRVLRVVTSVGANY